MNNQATRIQEFLEKTLNDLPNLNRDDLYSTVNTLDSILIRHYDEKVAYKTDLKSIIRELNSIVVDKNDNPPLSWSLTDVKGWYRPILVAMISEIELLGLQSKDDIKVDKSINVSINQNQSQEQKQIQKQTVDIFLESIKDELTGKQFKEIQEIIRNEPDIEKSKLKIFEKLKDFGINVCSSILGNIITNPNIINGLI